LRGCSVLRPENVVFDLRLCRLGAIEIGFQMFGRPYTVLHELDGEPESRTNKNILSQLEDNKRVEIPNNLEALVGLEKKFHDSYGAKKFFEDPGNITDGLRDVVRQLFG